jgi:hypothetical protein
MGGPPAWGLGEGLTTPHCENKSLLRNIHRRSLGPGLIGSNKNKQHRTLMGKDLIRGS